MFKKLLVPVDMSADKPGSLNLPRASEMQKAFNAEVQLLMVLPGYSNPMVASFFPENAQKKMQQEMTETLTKLAEAHFDTPPHIVVKTGRRAQEIIDAAADWGADVIVLGGRAKAGQGIDRMLGSVGSAVASRAHCTVLIAR